MGAVQKAAPAVQKAVQQATPAPMQKAANTVASNVNAPTIAHDFGAGGVKSLEGGNNVAGRAIDANPNLSTYYNNPDPMWKSGGPFGSNPAVQQEQKVADKATVAAGGNPGGAAGKTGGGGGSAAPGIGGLGSGSAIGGMFGTAGGAGGTGFSGPQFAPITNPVSAQDLAGGKAETMGSIAGAQQLMDALNAARSASNQQTSYLKGVDQYNQLAGAGGVSDQQVAAQQLKNVLEQQQNVANGVGPNPAQAMLTQATGQNVANQAALMAGQRGASANAGLMARQAALAGGNLQQQAAGQAATMQANQQLNALNNMGGLANSLGGVGAGLSGQQLGALNTIGGIANNQVGNALSGSNNLINGTLANQGQMLGGAGAYNTAQTGMYGNVNSANASMANTRMAQQPGALGGVANAAGPAIQWAANSFGGSSAPASTSTVGTTPPDEPTTVSDGGQDASSTALVDNSRANTSAVATPKVNIPKMKFAEGGDVEEGASPADLAPEYDPSTDAGYVKNTETELIPQAPTPNAPQSSFGQFMQSMTNGIALGGIQPMPKAAAASSSAPAKSKDDYSWVAPLVTAAAQAAAAARGGLASHGGNVAAKKASQKAEKSGNSYANDKIPAMLSEGEIVIPRSVVQSNDPVRSSADFVAKVLAKRKK